MKRAVRSMMATVTAALLVAGCTAAPAAPSPQATRAGVGATATATATVSIAARMCSASQLTATISGWEGNTGTPRAWVTVLDASGRACEMRGKARAEIVDAAGAVVGDEGRGSAAALGSDEAFELAPGESVRTVVSWANWCSARGPAQSVTVAFELPFDLGRVAATTSDPAPVPDCQLEAGSPPIVGSEPWRP